MRLFIVRHGVTDWNRLGRAQGHRDIPLNEDGLDQARRFAATFDVRADHIFTSDLARAHATAKHYADRHALEVQVREALRERSFGDFEGEPYHWVTEQMESRAMAEGIHLAAVRPPNGESFHDVWQRLDGFVEELRELDGTVAAFAHGGSGSVLMARLLDGRPEMARSFRFGNTGFSELERRGNRYVLVRYNDSRHLEAELATTY